MTFGATACILPLLYCIQSFLMATISILRNIHMRNLWMLPIECCLISYNTPQPRYHTPQKHPGAELVTKPWLFIGKAESQKLTRSAVVRPRITEPASALLLLQRALRVTS